MATIYSSILKLNNSGSEATLDAQNLRGTSLQIDSFNSSSLAKIGTGTAAAPGKRALGTIIHTSASFDRKYYAYLGGDSDGGDPNISGSAWSDTSNWAQIATSGSSFEFVDVFASGNITASGNIHAAGDISANDITASGGIIAGGDISASGTVYADAFNSATGGTGISFGDNLIVGGFISASGAITTDSNISASGHITASGLHITGDISASHITALSMSGDGSGLTGIVSSLSYIGDTGGSQTTDLKTEYLTFAGGNGITTTGTDDTMSIAVDAAQTNIISIYNTNLKLGYGASHAHIDFSTDNNILFDIDNSLKVKIISTGLDVTGTITASGIIHARGKLVTDSDVSASGAIYATGNISGSAIQGASLSISGYSVAVEGGSAIDQDVTSDGNPSWSGGISAGTIDIGETAGVINTTSGNLTIGSSGGTTTINDTNVILEGNLIINGTTTTIASQNLNVADQFIFAASGSLGTSDGGLIVQYGSGDYTSGSAIFHDASAGRWGVAKNVGSGSSVIVQTNRGTGSNQIGGYLVTVMSKALGGTVPSSSVGDNAGSASYGYGEIILDSTGDKDIWILST